MQAQSKRTKRHDRYILKQVIMALLVAGVATQAKSAAAEDVQTQKDFSIWYERSVIGGGAASDAIAPDSQLRIYKWSSPLRIHAQFDDLSPEQAEALSGYLNQYAKIISDQTEMQVQFDGSDSSETANILVLVGRTVAESVRAHEQEVAAVVNDGGAKAAKLLANPKNENEHCSSSLGASTEGEINNALVFAPNSENLAVTKKCLGRMIFTALGMLAPDLKSDSVLNRDDSADLPTKDDRVAMRIQYIDQIQLGSTPSSIVSIIQQARDQGLLP